MSEASKVWRIDVDGRDHEIEVDHSTLTGKIRIKVDGAEIDDSRLLLTAREFDFPVDTAVAHLEVEYAHGGFSVRSELHVDGRYVEPLRG